MQENFEYCQRSELVYEGGKVDDPRDPGGRTNQGITQRVYNGYRRRRNFPQRDVYKMEAAERDEIYREQYWKAIRGDDLPSGIDMVVYDGAVNSGPVQSIKWLQRALNVTVDGHLGESTLRALEECTDNDALVRRICDRRLVFLKSLTTWGAFGKGWSRRVASVQRAGFNMATGSVPAEATYIEGAHRKAMLSDAKVTPQTALADTSASGGAATATITQATTTLQPLADKSDSLALLFTALTVLGVLVTIGGLLWGMYARKKRADLHDALDLAPVRPEPANDNAVAPDDEERDAA